MSEPLVSVSGVRGVVGDSFTEDAVRTWAGAFAWWVRRRHGSTLPTVVIGRDPRPSGSWAIEVAARELERHGIQTILLGVVPTPTVQLTVRRRRAAGGLVVSGSHNPGEWNALKFLGGDGVFLSAAEMEDVAALARASRDHTSDEASAPAAGRVPDSGAITYHVAHVCSSLPITAERIRARKFRVVVDPVNGAGALAIPRLLEALGASVTSINGEPHGRFAHPPEPTPQHLAALGAAVQAEQADLGVAVDPDADRLVLVDESGTVLSEECTVTLAARAILEEVAEARAVPVVVNLSTTRMVDAVARRFGTTVVRTPVGERYVVEGLRAHRALVGGEGNGGVIVPRSHEGRDSLVGIALILDLLARRAVSLSRLVRELPAFVMRKEKLPWRGAWEQAAVRRRLTGVLPGAEISVLDGVRADLPRGWVHLRPSNTEPVVRLIGEAESAADLARMLARVREAFGVALPAEEIAHVG